MTRWALFAAIGIFALSFTTMLGLSFFGDGSAAQDAVFETCKWLTAISAVAILGLIRR